MLKQYLITLFEWIGLIVISGLVWALIVGNYNNETSPANVYPSAFNDSVYMNSVEVFSSRLYNDLDKNGKGYADATSTIWGNVEGSSHSTEDKGEST